MHIKEMLHDYEMVKDRLTLRLINKNADAYTPHGQFLDLDVIAALRFPSESGGDVSFVKVNYQLLNVWWKSFREVYAMAKANLELEETVVCSIEEHMRKFTDIPCFEEGPIPLYILTNESGIHGATHVMKESVLKEMAEKCDSDIFVIPSSVHEVLLIPVEDGADGDEMTAIIKDINGSILDPKDILSDHVYVYTKDFGWCK